MIHTELVQTVVRALIGEQPVLDFNRIVSGLPRSIQSEVIMFAAVDLPKFLAEKEPSSEWYHAKTEGYEVEDRDTFTFKGGKTWLRRIGCHFIDHIN